MVQYYPVVTGSLTINGSLSVSGPMSITGSIAGTSSLATNAFTASSADAFNIRGALTGSNAIFTGTITAQTLSVQQVTSSIVYSSGSNIFGYQLTDRQTFTGSMYITGSTLIVNGGTICNTGNTYFGGMSIINSCLGIGTATPVSKLTVYDTTDVEIRLQTTNTGTTSNDGFNIGLQNSTCDVYFNQRENANLFINTSGSIRLAINGGGCMGIGTITPCAFLHTVIKTCYGTNGTTANSYPIAMFSQCDCAGGTRGLEIGVPTGGVSSPVYLKVSNTGARLAILDSSNNEDLTITSGKLGIRCSSPGVSLVIGGTDALKLPTGTTAQRPTGDAGMVRMNTTTGQPEWYNTATSMWAAFAEQTNGYLVEYLVVGGGGAGGYDNGAGGGAGGFVLGCELGVVSCMGYSVIVGAGGSPTTGVSGFGGASCFNGVVALGGGGAGGQSSIGGDGGSGGGSMYYPIGAIRGGFGTIGQGFEGGCWTTLSSPWIGSGGGGASQRGFDGPFNGMGGAGKASTLLGNTCYYAGGGNGSGDSPGCQTQSLGGGGIAGNPTGGNANTNSGSGGGGGINGGNYGGNGGSGVVIIRYAGCQRGSGGTICSYCGTTIHVFTSSGTFVA
jgi:hypothetical protein